MILQAGDPEPEVLGPLGERRVLERHGDRGHARLGQRAAEEERPLRRRPHEEIVRPVAIEVADCHREAEHLDALGGLDGQAALEARGPLAEDHHLAEPRDELRQADGNLVIAIAAQVADREGPEPVLRRQLLVEGHVARDHLEVRIDAVRDDGELVLAEDDLILGRTAHDVAPRHRRPEVQVDAARVVALDEVELHLPGRGDPRASGRTCGRAPG